LFTYSFFPRIDSKLLLLSGEKQGFYEEKKRIAFLVAFTNSKITLQLIVSDIAGL